MVLGGSAWSGVHGWGWYPSMHWGRHTPLWTEWQTGVKILPCPKLRLRAVTIKKTRCRCRTVLDMFNNWKNKQNSHENDILNQQKLCIFYVIPSYTYSNLCRFIPSTELENKMVCTAEIWVEILQGKEWCWTYKKAGSYTMFTMCHNQRSQAGKLLQVRVTFTAKV